MNPSERERFCYIGDGVYAEFDGYGIWLRAGHHEDGLCDNKVYLEPSALRCLNEFYAIVKERAKHGSV